jgi:hypothetical protein
MKRAEARREVRRLAGELAKCRGATQGHQAISGFVLGGLYALDRALDLGFVARSFAFRSASYQGELTRLAQGLFAGSERKPKKWLAGFYVNSSLQHFAGAYHRLLRILTGKDHLSVPCLVDIAVAQGHFSRSDVQALGEAHRDVNGLKHGPGGLLKRRRVSDIALAVAAAGQAVALCERVSLPAPRSTRSGPVVS